MDPNARQREAIDSRSTNNVVIAGPGTGKSKVILFRACQLVDNGVAPHDIVLASFTNASVRDLRRSLETDEAYSSARECRTSTFHSLALRSLIRNDPDHPRVFIADDWEERFLIDPFLKRSLALPSITRARNQRRDFDSRWCHATEDPEEWLSEEDHRREFLRAFSLVKGSLNFTTRGELTYRWWLLLSNEPAATNTDVGIDFHHLMVDEYQDLNECEHQILEMLGRRGVAVFVVGDPNQSIYEGMRHAHPELCGTFADRFRDSSVIVLNETYRCPQALLSVAAALMDGRPGAEGVPSISHRPNEGDFEIVNYINETAEATGVAAVANHLAAERPEERILILYPVRQVGGLVSGALAAITIANTSSLEGVPRSGNRTGID